MSCSSRALVICRAADGAEVRFPLSAVRAYDADQAARYAASHDTGTAGDRSGSSDDATGGSQGDCDPSYEGACLDPNAYDYDCDGGSGDGPDYVGPVQVVGDDHYGLDRDGEGIACEDSSDRSHSYSDPSDGYDPGTPTTEDFGSGSGSVGTCADGTLSDSIGRPGACSHHGGVG